MLAGTLAINSDIAKATKRKAPFPGLVESG
jgi:hypothetical protein